MKETGITDMQDRLIKNLSKGYRQRVGIAQAMLGDPEVIILDEPTVGLDPKQIIEIRELIKSLGTTHTVVLSSHILSEISAVCDYVLIISKGKLVAQDTLENLSAHIHQARPFAYWFPERKAASDGDRYGKRQHNRLYLRLTGRTSVSCSRITIRAIPISAPGFRTPS